MSRTGVAVVVLIAAGPLAVVSGCTGTGTTQCNGICRAEEPAAFRLSCIPIEAPSVVASAPC